MKQLFDLNRLLLFLNSLSINLSDIQKEQFVMFQALIKKRSIRQNLVSKNDVSHLIERHFLPSIFFLETLPSDINGRIIDIGSGAGFPGIVLKILRPEISLTLLDSSHKKVLFLEEVCENLDLDCVIINQGCEEYKPDGSDYYRFIVSRAVARLKILWDWSGHMLQTGGQLITLKGGDFQPELEEISDYNCKIEIVRPGEKWLKESNFLKQKYIVKMEK